MGFVVLPRGRHTEEAPIEKRHTAARDALVERSREQYAPVMATR
jgi:hypothetical protein